jgi:hypothetical protein
LTDLIKHHKRLAEENEWSKEKTAEVLLGTMACMEWEFIYPEPKLADGSTDS